MCGRIGEDSYTGDKVTLGTQDAWVLIVISTNGKVGCKSDRW